MKTGVANLPLHGGGCPKWLFPRMRKLSGAIAEIIIDEYSQEEFLRRIADPFFFQSYANVAGWDWHSSGATPVLCAALKEAFNKNELGIKFTGGKGSTSRKTPKEIGEVGDTFSFSDQKIEHMKYASKMAAKVDSNLIQCNPPYQLYHHSFVLTERGKWCVVQQAMNLENRYARRYHWLSDNVQSFVNEPHNGICGEKENKVLNMTAKKNEAARKASVDLVNDNPIHLKKYFSKQLQLNYFFNNNFNNNHSSSCRELTMPSHHQIPQLSKRIMESLQKAYELQPQNYEELIALKGIGPKSVRTLALISELIYGNELSWKDPVRFSFALGGKDGIPYPINKKHYDKSIEILTSAIRNAKLNDKEKIVAIKKLGSYIY